VKKDELSPEAKTKLEKLESKEITEPPQVNEAEKVIVEDTYKKAAEKKFTDLKNKVNESIKSKNEKELKKLKQVLSQFISNPNYQLEKTAAEELAKKLESALKKSNTSKDNSSDIPWKIVAPVALVVVAFLVGAFIYTRKRKSHSR
jgi:lipopolysaccharide export LptBFGC system permease protein LptF